MLTAVHQLAADASQHHALHILAVIVLIAAIIGTIICLASLLGLAPAPLRRPGGTTGYGYLGAPLLVTIILWVVYFVLLSTYG